MKIGLTVTLMILLTAANCYAQEWNDVVFSDPSGTGARISTVLGSSTAFGGQSVDSSNTYIGTSQYDPTGGVGGTMVQGGFIDIQNFATADSVSTNATAIFDLRRAREISYQGTALSSALVTTMPRAGDRFSFSANIAEFEGELGGGVSFGYAPNERVMFHLGHARSDDTHLTRGGISVSW